MQTPAFTGCQHRGWWTRPVSHLKVMSLVVQRSRIAADVRWHATEMKETHLLPPASFPPRETSSTSFTSWLSSFGITAQVLHIQHHVTHRTNWTEVFQVNWKVCHSFSACVRVSNINRTSSERNTPTAEVSPWQCDYWTGPPERKSG